MSIRNGLGHIFTKQGETVKGKFINNFDTMFIFMAFNDFDFYRNFLSFILKKSLNLTITIFCPQDASKMNPSLSIQLDHFNKVFVSNNAKRHFASTVSKIEIILLQLIIPSQFHFVSLKIIFTNIKSTQSWFIIKRWESISQRV